MAKIVEGELIAQNVQIAIVVSRFNEIITKSLLDGACNSLTRHGISDDSITIIWVPGAFEIPLASQKAATSGKFAAVITLGAVIQGDTPHFDQVVSGVTSGVAKVSLDTGVPVVYGVLTTNTVDQAMDRAGIKLGNKGAEAAVTAIEMINLIKKI
ncbi:MAG: 6,7-dimethyl-8-ribityllumazine synthase [Fibrobacterales bacterium]